MSQAVLWTSECNAISSSVAPLPLPHLISSIPKQKLLLWEKRLCGTQTCLQAVSLVVSMSVYTVEHFSFNQTACETIDLLKTIPKQCTQFSPPKHLSQNFPKKKKVASLLQIHKEYRSSQPSSFDLWGMNGFPRCKFPLSEQILCSAGFKWVSAGNNSPHKEGRSGAFLPRGQADLKDQNEDTILEMGHKCAELERHYTKKHILKVVGN